MPPAGELLHNPYILVELGGAAIAGVVSLGAIALLAIHRLNKTRRELNNVDNILKAANETSKKYRIN